MRVLWFSINTSCYNSALTKGGYNGGGWVSSLEKIIKKQKNIHLGIAFEFESDKFKDSIDGVDYYPINGLKNKKEHFIHEFTINTALNKYLTQYCLSEYVRKIDKGDMFSKKNDEIQKDLSFFYWHEYQNVTENKVIFRFLAELKMRMYGIKIMFK